MDAGWNSADHLPRDAQPLQDPTPTLTKLAREGAILDQAYAMHICSPSRAALLTGRHPIRYGMHFFNIPVDKPEGLSLKEKLLPSLLKREGYSTHMVGKWHVGFCNVSYLPSSRGFDTAFGPLVGHMSYDSHEYDFPRSDGQPTLVGLTIHNNTRRVRNTSPTHSTKLLTDVAVKTILNHDQRTPLFLYLPYIAPHALPVASPDVLDLVSTKILPHSSLKRRKHMAVIRMLDSAVGRVVQTLKRKGMWKKTVFVFSSDNGPDPHYGSSFPLRGKKGSLFEGGSRVPAFISSSLLSRPGRRERFPVHITDWFPTLLSLAGVEEFGERKIDGVNFAPRLFKGYDGSTGKNIRLNMLYTLRTPKSLSPGNCSVVAGAYRHGDMKVIVFGTKHLRKQDHKSGWYIGGDNFSKSDVAPQFHHHSGKAAENLPQWHKLIQSADDGRWWGLFDLRRDPSEQTNLLLNRTQTFRRLRQKLLDFCDDVQPDSETLKQVRKSDPSLWGGFWTHGWC